MQDPAPPKFYGTSADAENNYSSTPVIQAPKVCYCVFLVLIYFN